MDIKIKMEKIIQYSALGYDITFTYIYGKEALRMVKRYSHKAEKSLCCEQIVDHEKLLYDEDRFLDIIRFLYKDIQNQEESGIYYEPLEN